MPEMASQIDTGAGAKYMTVCDVQAAFHHIPIADEGQDKTTFVRRRGE